MGMGVGVGGWGGDGFRQGRRGAEIWGARIAGMKPRAGGLDLTPDIQRAENAAHDLPQTGADPQGVATAGRRR